MKKIIKLLSESMENYGKLCGEAPMLGSNKK